MHKADRIETIHLLQAFHLLESFFSSSLDCVQRFLRTASLSRYLYSLLTLNEVRRQLRKTGRATLLFLLATNYKGLETLPLAGTALNSYACLDSTDCLLIQDCLERIASEHVASWPEIRDVFTWRVSILTCFLLGEWLPRLPLLVRRPPCFWRRKSGVEEVEFGSFWL